MYTFCTVFDSNYLLRGVALYQSLRRHCGAFELWVVCLDEECHRILSGLDLPGMRLLRLADLEAEDQELRIARTNRNFLEFYWTAKSSLFYYLFKHVPETNIVTYLDADLFYFDSPDIVFQEFEGSSILIVEHRFPAPLRSREKFGLYNAGYISFRRDEQGFACLEDWHAKCMQWCYHRVEADRFGDQKYLDAWPARFPGVLSLRQKGANLGPWNVSNYRISAGPAGVQVDEDPLVFFHFHGLKFAGSIMLESGLKAYETKLLPEYREHLFRPYMAALLEAGALVRAAGFSVPGPSLISQVVSSTAKKVYNSLGQPKFLKQAATVPLKLLRRVRNA